MGKSFIDWVTSPPGLLITGGVILLIVALVILLLNGRKTKKEIKETNASGDNSLSASSVTPNDAGMINNNAVPQSMGVADTNQVNLTGGVSNSIGEVNMNPVPLENQNPVGMDNVVTSNTFNTNPMVNNEVVGTNMGMGVGDASVQQLAEPQPAEPQPVMSQPVMPSSVITNEMGINNVQVPETAQTQEVQGVENFNQIAQNESVNNLVENVIPQPAMATSVVEINPQPVSGVNNSSAELVMPAADNYNQPVAGISTPAVDNTNNTPIESLEAPVQQEVVNPTVAPSAPVIYGGASPSVGNINVQPEVQTHQIYGGADPLQNTQTNLKVPTNNVAYNYAMDTPVSTLSTSYMGESNATNPVVNEPVVPSINAVAAPQIPTINPVAPIAPVAPINPVNPVQPQ